MSAYLNLPVEKFFEECKERVLTDKIRIAQKQKILPPSKTQEVTLWQTYFLVSCIDFPQGVILRCTVPIITTMSDPLSKFVFEDDKKHYTERHAEILRGIEELAGQLKDGEWAWE